MMIDYSSQAFEQAYTYFGNDLGAVWTKEKTFFRLWAPTAQKAAVKLYKGGTAGADDRLDTIEMTADINGTWIAEQVGDLNGVYYTYCVTIDGQTAEAVDPYARAVGVNGLRGMVIDLCATNPVGWEADTNPNPGGNITDAVLYELHIRDLTADSSAGVLPQNRGRYCGVIETGTVNAHGLPTGLDHIKALGITYLHLLPAFDYGSVDETKPGAQYNWGYDPHNFNVPEGSYSSDPYNGAVRVREFKEMVLGLHQAGISVVMDVVYNHVYDREKFCFNQLVPGYFSRINDGEYSNGSFCGNDTASERSMVRKYIVDSVLYWAQEYHIDGFRFDIASLLDAQTINEAMDAVHAIRPDVIFYGEGWDMPTKVTKEGISLATQQNSHLVPKLSFFSDTIRDGLLGDWRTDDAPGYVSNASGFRGTVENCFMARSGWTTAPTQTVNYVSCHDNLTVYDRLRLSNPDANEEELAQINKLAAAICMTAQGTPFFQAGEEFLRSKPKTDGTFDHNSYNSGDGINSLKWDKLKKYQQVVSYYQGLIAFRKAHPALRMKTPEEIAAHIHPVENLPGNTLAFHITAGANGEKNALFVIFNPGKSCVCVPLPAGNWNVCINGETAGTEVLAQASQTITVEPISATVLVNI